MPDGNLESLVTVKIEWTQDENGRHVFNEVEGTEQVFPAQLILLAMGFVGPEKGGAIEELELELDDRGNVKCDDEYRTSTEGVFAAGDMRRGQSLVVWGHPRRTRSRASGGQAPDGCHAPTQCQRR